MNPRTIFQKRGAVALFRPLVLFLSFMLASPALWASGMNSYHQRNLVSDGFVKAEHVDPNLVDAWGLVFNPSSAVWISDTGSGRSTLYKGLGVIQSLVVKIPGGSPTGIVYNGTSGFRVEKDGHFGASRFIFATEKGDIAGWSYYADPENAVLEVNNGAKTGAVYKGLAVITSGGVAYDLYATDFHNGRVDVFDNYFKPVAMPAGAFTDPKLPAGFAPFGIQNIDGNLYVTYAKQDAKKHDAVNGAGSGVVDVYNASGDLIRRLASGGHLNAPWGVAKAPANFGKFSNDILVANFGDGTISAYSASGKFQGQLRLPGHRLLKIDGLWGISFGNGKDGQPTNSLFFAAGPDHEKHGLYGRIDPKG